MIIGNSRYNPSKHRRLPKLFILEILCRFMARKAKRASRRYGRRAARAIGRGGNRMMRTLGFSKSGVHVGKLIGAASAMAIPFIPAYTPDGVNTYSALDMIMGKANWATQTMSQRAWSASKACMAVGLGYIPASDAAPASYRNKGIAGMGVAAGIGLTVAGKFVNPLMGGSAVKL